MSERGSEGGRKGEKINGGGREREKEVSIEQKGGHKINIESL